MNEQNLSQWFDLAEQKPWEVGVYELGYPDDDGNKYYSWFDGKNFNGGFLKKETAIKYKDRPIFILRANRWRGLSTNPEVKKKQGNKRVTRHIVVKWNEWGGTDSIVGSYENPKIAQAHADRLPTAHVKTIRFRTPE